MTDAREKKIRYNNEYNRRKYKSYTIRLSREEDADVIAFLERFNVNQIVTDLVRKKARNEDH